MGFTKTEALLTELLIQSEKQTALLEEIRKLLQPPMILEAKMSDEQREKIIKAFEGLEENPEWIQ